MGRLAHLRLRHFRNYRALDLEVTPGLTAFVGANGQGKTNLLEAIHYLSLLRSFRTRRIRDLRQWDASFLFVEGALASASSAFDCHKLTVTYATTRRLRLDGKVVAKASDFINQLICIAGLSGHFKKIFNMVGITKFAKIYNTVGEAMADLAGES